MELRKLLSLRITFTCFTVIFVLSLAEGMLLAMPNEPAARVGHVTVFLGALLPGTIVGLLARSGRKGFFNALVAGLPSLVVIILLVTYGRPLRFYPTFEENGERLIYQYAFRGIMFGLLLTISTAVGSFVGEEAAEPEVIKVRELKPVEDVEEVEKRIEEEVQREKTSGGHLVEEAEEKGEAEQPPPEGVEPPTPAEREAEARVCSSCGEEVPSTAAYCPFCGQAVEQQP